ncbi:MAG: septal ring lytic transglycosylase RlpA family protein [Methyloceanibacter sp.]
MGKKAPALAVARLALRGVIASPAGLVLSFLLLGCVAASVVACGQRGNGEKLGERVIPLGQPVPKGGGAYRIGSPYRVAGVTYQPREEPSYDRVGKASWYGELFQGRRTANGEIYDMERLSAASPTLPLPVYARVTNLENRRSIVVRVNDRGPYANDRIMDLSRRSAELLGFRQRGTTRVRVQYLGKAPLNGDDSYERRYLASQGWVQIASNRRAPARSPEPVAVGSIAGGAPSGLRWQARAQAPAAVQASRERRPPAQAPDKASSGIMIQAGSFRSRDNAERARSLLGDIAGVEVAPVEVGDGTLFRVRLGPFADRSEAAAALPQVTEAGYSGAKIITN